MKRREFSAKLQNPRPSVLWSFYRASSTVGRNSTKQQRQSAIKARSKTKNANEFSEVITVKKKEPINGFSKSQIDALARCFLPAIQKFFESEEGKREFEEWKRQQAAKKQEEEKEDTE